MNKKDARRKKKLGLPKYYSTFENTSQAGMVYRSWQFKKAKINSNLLQLGRRYYMNWVFAKLGVVNEVPATLQED